MSRTERAASVAEVLDLFEQWGTERYDEEVTQLDHALQTAALARAEAADPPLVAAALLHDVGHLLELRDGGATSGDVVLDLAHEARGARYLAGLFPASVTRPIALHVAAKRYRCSVDPAYHHGLSAGSSHSLARQGGPMTPADAGRFRAHPDARRAVRLRGWDDGGKLHDLGVPRLADYHDLLRDLAR